MVHSTSWHYEGGGIVLSYLVYSDRLALPADCGRARLDALPAPEEPASDAHDRDRTVASHALRHLAFLVAQDPKEYRAKLSAETVRSLADSNPPLRAGCATRHITASDRPSKKNARALSGFVAAHIPRRLPQAM